MKRKAADSFSLIEVTLCIGLVSFSMLSILSLLPMGLQTVRESSDQLGLSNISKDISGELQRLPFSKLAGLDGSQTFYQENGAAAVDGSTNGYFQADFKIVPPSMPGVTPTYANGTQLVQVTVTYPADIPAPGRKTAVFSIWAAKQSSN